MTRAELIPAARQIVDELASEFPHYADRLNTITWSLNDRAFTRMGRAWWTKPHVELSAKALTLNPYLLRETVLHELAHILVPSANDGHNKRWKDVYLEIGGHGNRIIGECLNAPPKKIRAAKCSECDEIFYLYVSKAAKIERGRHMYHRACGSYSYLYLIWETPKKMRRVNGEYVFA